MLGGTGIVVDDFSARAMAQAVVELMNSPERRAQMGAAGRKRVLANFTAAGQAPKIYEEIERLAERGGRTGD